MSVDPQQMLAQYKALYGDPKMQGLNQLQQGLAGGAPPGTNATAGQTNAVAQLMVALMRSQRQKQLQQQQNQQSPPGTTPAVPMAQGQTTSSPPATPMGTPMTSGGQ